MLVPTWGKNLSQTMQLAVLDRSRWWVQPGLYPGWVPPGSPPGTKKTFIKYYYWYATALKRNFDKTGNRSLLEEVLPGYLVQFKQFASGAAPGDQQMMLTIDQRGTECLYNVPGNDAQEATISGSGCRPAGTEPDVRRGGGACRAVCRNWRRSVCGGDGCRGS